MQLASVAAMRSPHSSKRSRSHRRVPGGGSGASKRIVYMDSTGSEFSACSVAAKAGDALWIGAVHDRGMLRCSGS